MPISETWIATGRGPVVEDDRERKHPVSENKSFPAVLNVCSSAVLDIDCEGRCQRSHIEINSCPLLNKETPVHCEVQHQHNIPSVEPSMADILDPAKFNGSSGSSEKGADREPTSAVVAAGHLVYSSSAAAYTYTVCQRIPIVVSQCKVSTYVLGK